MAIPYRNNGGVYANMDFGSYQFQEYPKHIKTGAHGQFQAVYSAEEEAKLLSTLGDQEVIDSLQPPHDAEKEALIARARFLGVPINKLWSNAKIQSALSAAESAVDELPPEEEASTATPEDLRNLVARAKELGIRSARVSWGEGRLKAHITEAENA